MISATGPLTAAEPSKWIPVDLAKLWGEVSNLEYVIPDFLGIREAGILASETGVGKTNVLVAIAVAAASGKPVLGHFAASEPRRVLYVDMESGHRELTRRVTRITKGMDAHPSLVTTHLRLFCGDWPDNATGVGVPDAGADDWFVRLQDAAREFEAEIVILDTFVSLFRGEENSNQEVRQWYSKVVAPLQRDPKCSVLLAHHFNKSQGAGESRPTLARLRGASDLVGFPDKVWVLMNKKESANEHGVLVKCALFNAKARRGDPLEDLEVSVEDISSDPPAIAVIAAPLKGNNGSDKVQAWLMDAGPTGLLRQEILTRLWEEKGSGGSAGADKMATRALRQLRERGLVECRKEGAETRYWLVECVQRAQAA